MASRTLSKHAGGGRVISQRAHVSRSLRNFRLSPDRTALTRIVRNLDGDQIKVDQTGNLVIHKIQIA